ncbi:MAG: zinc-binding dehydrogenase [Gaiellaceae bacterium]
MKTKTTDPGLPENYDPSQYPAFAVTVDVVILTMSEGTLHVLLVRRGEAPFKGMWAIPGGFKRPAETLDEAAKRELLEETGVDGASLLTQFGAYGDPERDPRLNVVTIAYLAVVRDVGAIEAGTDAADAALVPAADVLNERLDLAFDHLRIVRDAIERVRLELEVTGIATAFVGPTFTLAELRTVYEALWGVQLDAANFRRSVVAEEGWVIPTGRRARPGSAGGRAAGRGRARPAAGPLSSSERGGPGATAGRSIASIEPTRGSEPMRAVVHDRYGPPDVLRLDEVERPVPEEDEVLVRVHATTATRTDCGLRSAEYFITRFFTGLFRPKRRFVGIELAGVVEAAGAAVTEFAVDDRVFGIRSGANADYVCVAESGVLAHMPDGMSFEEAAAVADGAISAMSLLRSAGLRTGHRILVYGASGSIGTGTVQVAKHLGAHVTAVCNTKNVELVRSLGAELVIDYQQEDFTQNGESYDVVFDAVGKHSFRRCRRSLKPGGMYIATDGLHNVLWALWTWRIGDRKAKLGMVRYTKKDVLFLEELLEGGNYRAVIDRSYPLEDVVDAHRYVDTQQKTGNVVLTLCGGAR